VVRRWRTTWRLLFQIIIINLFWISSLLLDSSRPQQFDSHRLTFHYYWKRDSWTGVFRPASAGAMNKLDSPVSFLSLSVCFSRLVGGLFFYFFCIFFFFFLSRYMCAPLCLFDRYHVTWRDDVRVERFRRRAFRFQFPSA
jgi:hypothetical protein